MPELSLGVVDQSPIRKGGTGADAVRETIELARHCEANGYSRYWIAEHHNSRGLASASPEILITAIAGQTSRIRVGSGGVMLTHYSPLKVAEQFRMLEALYPGRIDLGLGRAPGGDRRTAQALAPTGTEVGVDFYPQQLLYLYHYLTDTIPEGHAYAGIRATPTGDNLPEMWLLGSSPNSAMFAAELGWSFCWAQFINPEGGERICEDYRRRFRPSELLAEPRVAVAVSAITADTDEEAENLAWSRWIWRLRSRDSEELGIPSPEEARAMPLTEPELDSIAFSRSRSIYGSPGHVAARIREVAGDFGASEALVLTITYDFEARKRSYELLAREMGIGPHAPAVSSASHGPV